MDIDTNDLEPTVSIGFKSWNDVFLTLFFFSLFSSGSVLNVTLLFTIIKERLYFSSHNLYIMNLAVSDLMIAIGILFFPTMDYALTDWPFGSIGCRISEVIRDSVTPVSLVTLTALSCERYKAVFSIGVQGHEKSRDRFSLGSCLKSKAGMTIILMWLASFVTMIPIIVTGTLVNLPPEKMADPKTCLLDRYEFLEPKILVVIRCFVTYVFPLIIIAHNYIAIVINLFSISKHLDRNNTALNRSRMRALSRAKLILLLVIVFIFCSFPCHIFLWIFYFARDDVLRTNYFWDNWRLIGSYLFYVYPILNPLFLYATSEQYKSLFDKYLFRCRRAVVVQEEEDDESRDRGGRGRDGSAGAWMRNEGFEMSHSGTTDTTPHSLT